MISSLTHLDGTWDARLHDWRGVGAAIQSPPTTLPFAEGVHVLDHQLLLPAGAVLRGAGRGKTILKFTKSLADLFGVNREWSFGGGLIQAKSVSGVVIEGLTIEFPLVPAVKHHEERGWNGISVKGCTNVAVRDVEILNCDSGIFVEGTSSFVTVQGVRLSTLRTERNDGERFGAFSGHHGIEFQRATDCLLTDYDIRQRFIHDVSFENAKRIACVHGKAVAICLDHHESDGSSQILVDDLESDSLSRLWVSGGKEIYPANGGPGNTYWNIRKTSGGVPSSLPPWCATEGTRGIVIVSFASTDIRSDRYLEKITNLSPKSLYEFQRGNETLDITPGEEPPMPVPKFVIGDQAKATAQVNVRGGGSITAPLLGTQATGATGTVTAGPVTDTYIYYQINFTSGIDGWVGENNLEKVISVPSLDPKMSARAKLMNPTWTPLTDAEVLVVVP